MEEKPVASGLLTDDQREQMLCESPAGVENASVVSIKWLVGKNEFVVLDPGPSREWTEASLKEALRLAPISPDLLR
jgi:hypothetical protein